MNGFTTTGTVNIKHVDNTEPNCDLLHWQNYDNICFISPTSDLKEELCFLKYNTLKLL